MGFLRTPLFLDGNSPSHMCYWYRSQHLVLLVRYLFMANVEILVMYITVITITVRETLWIGPVKSGSNWIREWDVVPLIGHNRVEKHAILLGFSSI